jgi:hypothetical protein
MAVGVGGGWWRAGGGGGRTRSDKDRTLSRGEFVTRTRARRTLAAFALPRPESIIYPFRGRATVDSPRAPRPAPRGGGR